MKKLALTLALSLAGLGAASAADIPLGGGKLIFQGGLTTSGCNVTLDGKQGKDFDNEYVVQMPSGLSILNLGSISAATPDAYQALPNPSKRSGGIEGEGLLDIGIICPADLVIASIQDALGTPDSALAAAVGNAADLASILDNKGVLAFLNTPNAESGGFVTTSTNVGVLSPSPTSSAKGVGIVFLRTDHPDVGRKVVDLTGSQVQEGLQWAVDTMTDASGATTGGSVPAVSTSAQYDFAYVRINPVAATDPKKPTDGLVLGNGQLKHVVSFQFQYSSTLTSRPQ